MYNLSRLWGPRGRTLSSAGTLSAAAFVLFNIPHNIRATERFGSVVENLRADNGLCDISVDALTKLFATKNDARPVVGTLSKITI